MCTFPVFVIADTEENAVDKINKYIWFISMKKFAGSLVISFNQKDLFVKYARLPVLLH
jgi:hypothetical protein